MNHKHVSVKKLIKYIQEKQLSEVEATIYLDAQIDEQQKRGEKLSHATCNLYKELTGIDIKAATRDKVFNKRKFRASCLSSTLSQLDNRFAITKSEMKRDIILSVKDAKLEDESDVITISADDGDIVQALIQTRDPKIIRESLITMKEIVAKLEAHLKTME